MEAVIPKANIKAFCRALTCLGRIGSDLTIEQTGDSLLVFRTLSQSQSSYAQLSLYASFFDSLVALGPGGRNVRCKVNLKNLLSSLKSLAAVERLILQLDGEKNLLILELESTTKVRRTFLFNFEDQMQILQADYSRRSCENLIQADSRSLESCIANFSADLDEISFIPTERCLRIKSYVESQGLSEKQVLQTEYLIPQSEFQTYHLQKSTSEFTFCLKEFKALLGFCEAMSSSISIYFQQGGLPILLSNSADGESPLTLDVVVATLHLDASAIESVTSGTGAGILGTDAHVHGGPHLPPAGAAWRTSEMAPTQTQMPASSSMTQQSQQRAQPYRGSGGGSGGGVGSYSASQMSFQPMQLAQRRVSPTSATQQATEPSDDDGEHGDNENEVMGTPE